MEISSQTGSPWVENAEDQDSKETNQLTYAGWIYSAFRKPTSNGKPSVKQRVTGLLSPRADLISP